MIVTESVAIQFLLEVTVIAYVPLGKPLNEPVLFESEVPVPLSMANT